MGIKQDQKASYADYFNRLLKRTTDTGAVGGTPFFGSFRKYHYVDPSGTFAFPFLLRKARRAQQPIVLFLHSGGCFGLSNVNPLAECAKALRRLRGRDCTVLIPQTPYPLFSSDYPYTGALRQLCEWAAAQTQADPDRIYVFGVSYGGSLTWKCAFAYPAFFACAMPVMGICRSPKLTAYLDSPPAGKQMFTSDELFRQNVWTEDDVRSLRDMPIHIAHAADDTVVPVEYDDALAEALRALGAPVQYTRWDHSGHQMEKPFLKTEPWVDWMFAQSLRQRPSRPASE